jgi:hypothetical protein
VSNKILAIGDSSSDVPQDAHLNQHAARKMGYFRFMGIVAPPMRPNVQANGIQDLIA